MHKKKVGVPIVITYEVTKDLSISHESSVQRKLEDDLCLIRAEITFVHNVCIMIHHNASSDYRMLLVGMLIVGMLIVLALMTRAICCIMSFGHLCISANGVTGKK